MSEDRPLFPAPNLLDEARAILKTNGFNDDELREMDPSALTDAMHQVLNARSTNERFQRFVAAGAISQEAASTMKFSERREFVHMRVALDAHRLDEDRASKATVPYSPPPVSDTMSRNEVLTLFAELIAVVAALKSENDELRRNLANVHHLQLAVLDRKELFDRLLSTDADFKNIEADLQIEEVSSLSTETTQSASLETNTETGDARDTTAAIHGLASHVVGLSAGRAVDVTSLNRRVARMKETAKTSAQLRSKGRVSFKIGEVTRPKKG